ncbi:hypothetical protein MUK42_05776 [Musa troglodytarum]|uniref:Uncharacterized protein n=1 Tax=Musa troglodytarum TaxID=320322 RepID=A0A9E7IKG9_9LILI|nr:hypothetical protein MUK42_05776 [Musa troglodytarum]
MNIRMLMIFIDCRYYAISSIFSFCLQIFRTLQHKFLSRWDHIIIWQVVSGERKEVVLKTDFLSSSVQMDVRGAGRGHQLKSGNAIGGFCHHQATGIGSVMPPPIIFQASALLILVLPKSAVSPRRPS